MEYEDITGYEGLYGVGKDGSIVSFKSGKPRILKHNVTKDGHHTVLLSKNGKTKRYSVPRLVAEAFVPNPDPENLKWVRQKNKELESFAVDNVEWFSLTEILHAPEARKKAVENLHKSLLYRNLSKEHEKLRRPVCAIDDDGDIVATFRSISEAKRMLNVSSIGQALKIGCRCAGYYWKYTEKQKEK